MRWALLLALAGCGGDECVPRVGSRLSHSIGYISSGKQIAGVSWSESIEKSAPLEHVAIVHPNGALSPDIPSTSSYGVAGTSTVLWHRDSAHPCKSGEKFEFVPLLYDGTTSAALPLAAQTLARTAVFDGTRYQLFWNVPSGGATGRVFHRTLDEDGTLGPEHDLGGLTAACVIAATDGNGTTLLVTEHDAYLVDSAGTSTLVWRSETWNGDAEVFYFDGEFHIDGAQFVSIDPVTKATRSNTNTGAIRYYPTESRLFALTTTDIVELDAAFRVIAHIPKPGTLTQAGTVGDELVFVTQRPVNIADFDGPQRISVETVDSWRMELAVDSPTETLDACQ
jgi:hypothetical protein